MFCPYVLLFVAAASVARVTCGQAPPTPPTPIIIVHKNSNYVLDGREDKVKLRRYRGQDSQHWKTEDAGDGKAYIINEETGKVLDTEGKARQNANIITCEKNSSEKQKWLIDVDGTILNAASKELVVDIPHTEPGGTLILYSNNGGNNQKFQFHKYDH